MANRIQIKRSLTSGNVPNVTDLLVGEFAVNIPDKKIFTKNGADQVVKLNVTDYSELTGTPSLGTAAAKDVPTTGDAATTEVVLGSDTRLTDARTPTAHNQAWSTITNTPTTATGYGITDVAPSSHVGSTGGAHGDATTTVSGFMSATDKTKLDGVATNANNYSLPVATDVVSGGVKLASATAQTVAANTVTSTASRTYGIQSNASGQLVVNVPWVDTNTVYTHPTGDGNLHVPATGTTSAGKVLTAGDEAGSLSWQTPSTIDSTKLPLSGGTMTGSITFAGNQVWPTFNQPTTGNAGTATKLETPRTLTIGSTGKAFDGSGDLTWTLAEIGATGLQYLTEVRNVAAPNASVPVHGVQASGAEASIDLVLGVKGSGAIVAQVPDGTATGGNKRGIYATDWQSFRSSSTQVASGNYSFIGGGELNTAKGPSSSVGGGYSNTASSNFASVGGGANNTAIGEAASVGGGRYNTASSNFASVGGGANNTAIGEAASVGGGRYNTASTNFASVGGGRYNTASTNFASVGGGELNTASGYGSSVGGGANNTAIGEATSVGGGDSNTASGEASAIPGGRNATTNSIRGLLAYGFFGGLGVVPGQNQMSFFGGRADTADATPTRITANAGAASASNQLTLRNNSAFRVRGTVVARNTSTNDCKEWTFEALIKRGANAAATSIVGTPTLTSTFADTAAASWAIAISADTPNGALAISATGAASTTIRWTAVVHSIEVA